MNPSPNEYELSSGRSRCRLLRKYPRRLPRPELDVKRIRLEKSRNPSTFHPLRSLLPLIVVRDSVHLVLRETLSLSLARDGGLQSLSLKGDLDLRISNADLTNLVISLPPAASYAQNSGSNDLQFKTHPNVDKKSWSDKGEIRLKEGKKGFPVGQGLGVLKWRMTGKDESVVPISSAFLIPAFRNDC